MLRLIDHHLGPRPTPVKVCADRIECRLGLEPMTRADWTTHDYNVHFCLGLENAADTPIEAVVQVGATSWDNLPELEPLLYSAPGDEGPWIPSTFSARTDRKKSYAIRVKLKPYEKLLLANTLPRRLDVLVQNFDRLAADGGARRTVIGRTVQGRDLVAYVYGDMESQGTLLVSSGFHPPEPDTLASEAIMAFLAGQESAQLLRQLAVVIVPIVNPDGYALQTQGSNVMGVNLFWDFRAADPRNCPEAVALWNFAAGITPRGYIDFHCYTFQTKKQPGPYCKPPSLYGNSRVQKTANLVNRRLLDVPYTEAVHGFSTYAPATLGARLTRLCDTITVAKYHLHLKEGAERCRSRGLEVFRTTAQTLIETGLATPGRSELRNRRGNELRMLWAGFLRPTLGLLRRGRFREVDFRRFALVTPDGAGKANA